MTELLWTGGWDSTFRLCQLARKECDVQPYYLILNRPCVEEEQNAISTILPLLRSKRGVRANIRDVQFIDYRDVAIPDDIQSAWEQFKGPPFALGGQYRFLSVFAREHPGIELGQERYWKKIGHLRSLLLEKGHMRVSSEGTGYFVKEDCDPAVWTLFGNMRMPISEMHEREMALLIRRWGYQDVMDHVWFCYTPVDVKPCGLCEPCLTKHKNGMDRLLGTEAIRRATLYNYLKKLPVNATLPDELKLHHKFKGIFNILRSLGMPCDADSLANMLRVQTKNM